jgi:hypothetical protein
MPRSGAQFLVNALIGEVKLDENHIAGNATYQDLTGSECPPLRQMLKFAYLVTS